MSVHCSFDVIGLVLYFFGVHNIFVGTASCFKALIFFILLLLSTRESIGAQLQLALAKADSEQLARQIAEEQLSDVEKEKTMLELEIKEMISRQKLEMSKKESLIASVRFVWLFSAEQAVSSFQIEQIGFYIVFRWSSLFSGYFQKCSD